MLKVSIDAEYLCVSRSTDARFLILPHSLFEEISFAGQRDHLHKWERILHIVYLFIAQ